MKIEPSAPVEVTIEHADAIRIRDEETLNMVHFADKGIEIIEDVELSNDGKTTVHEQDSFSVTGEVAGTFSGTNWPDTPAGDYVLVVHSGNDGPYYAVNSSGGLVEVEYDAEQNTVRIPDSAAAATDDLDDYWWTYYVNVTITLRPVDGAPMPAGYSQEAKLTFTAAGKQSFPAISFDEPGDYRYTLEQEISDKTVCWIDETRYEILVKVFVDEKTGELKDPVFTDATGEQKAEEFKFVNSVYEPCIMDPPILKRVVDENGNEIADTTGTYTFRLEAIGANASTAPMPDGAVGGSKDLTLTGSTKYVREGDFGPLYEDSKGTLAEFGVMQRKTPDAAFWAL